MSSNKNSELLKKYSHAIKTLEENIKNYNKKENKLKGYLINLNDYNNFKKQVNYEGNKKSQIKSYVIKENEKQIFIKDLEFKTNKYLINMLLNGNKYIIIDTAFYKIICEKGKSNSSSMDYYFTNYTSEMNLILKGENVIKFDNKNKNNIIEESMIKNKPSNNFDDIKKTYQSIKKYYDFENIVENQLKLKSELKNKEKGYLVEKAWIDNWKKEIQYDKIKNDYIIQKTSEKETLDELIYIFEKSNIRYLNLVDIKSPELNTKAKVEEYIKTKSLVLVNSDFITSLENSNNLKEIEYIIYDNTIEIIFDSNNSISFKAKDNILQLNSNLEQNINNIDTKNAKSQTSDTKAKEALLNKTGSKLNTEESANSDNKNLEDKEIEEKVNKYISYSIKLYIEYSKLKKQIDKKNDKKEKECYLINKNIIEEIQNIFCYKEINDILNINNELIKDYKGTKEEIDKIKKEIKLDNIIKKLKELDDNSIKENIKAKSKDKKYTDISKITKDKDSNNIFYYDNCNLINKDILNLLKDITKHEMDMAIKEACIYDEGEIIILIKEGTDKVINVGNLDKGNYLKIKQIIKEDGFSDIFKDIISSGYNYINSDKIDKAKILVVDNGKIIEGNISKPSQQETTKNKTNVDNKKTVKNGITKDNNSNKKDSLNPSTSKSKTKDNVLFIPKYSNSESLKVNKVKERNSRNNISNSTKIETPKIENNSNVPKENKEIKIDDKLKNLILLSINQKKDYSLASSSINKGYKVYLINSNLDALKFNDINSEISQNYKKIEQIVSEINKSEIPTISSKINEITPKLSQEKLKKLNEEIKSITSSSFQWEPKVEIKNLINSKNIKIFTEFIISPENTFNLLKKSFNITQNMKQVNHIHTIGGDIIYFDKIILYGKIDKNKFDIKYIFEFDTEIDLTKEIPEINKGVDSYIKTKSVFIEYISDDKVSPIISNFKIIGNVYKYNSFYDFSKCIDYKKYIKNDKLSKFISLYSFYNDIQNKLNKNYNTTEKYYLINENSIQEIQNICDYVKLKQIIEEKNINIDIGVGWVLPDEKKILKILKTIPKDIIEKYFSNNSPIKKIKKSETDIITIQNPNDINEYAMIYNNYWIIDKKIAELFIEGVSAYSAADNNIVDCTINEGKILVEYGKSLGNPKYVSIIGSVDPIDFFIINEYALIYKDYPGYASNISSIKKQINNYIQSLQLYNRTSPIIDSSFKEIGNIIQIEQTSDKRKKIINNPNRSKPPDKIISTPTPIQPLPRTDEYNLNSTLNVTSITLYFPYPPLIGLENIGATCYMNATLQCFCNIVKFVDYFKYNKYLINLVKNDYNKSSLSSSFKLLIEKLWPDNFNSNTKKSYAPYEYKNKISKMNSLFEGVQANDSKDLVNFIIMTLHQELNKVKNVSNSFNNNNNFGVSINQQTNQQLMFNNFIENFKKENHSIISDLFYAMNCNMIQCSMCKTQSYNYQTYFFLVFPLEEIRKYKINNFNQFNNFNNMFNNNEVNIYDCFEYEKRINFMSGQNAMYCNYCKNTCNSSMCTMLTTGPQILIIILNRGQGIQFNVKINFVEQLNLAYFIQFGNTGVNYELIGVITHLGDSGMSGHFIAYCKNPISKSWYQYNDAKVNPVNNFKKEVIDFAMPYLLFYKKLS